MSKITVSSIEDLKNHIQDICVKHLLASIDGAAKDLESIAKQAIIHAAGIEYKRYGEARFDTANGRRSPAQAIAEKHIEQLLKEKVGSWVKEAFDAEEHSLKQAVVKHMRDQFRDEMRRHVERHIDNEGRSIVRQMIEEVKEQAQSIVKDLAPDLPRVRVDESGSYDLSDASVFNTALGIKVLSVFAQSMSKD